MDAFEDIEQHLRALAGRPSPDPDAQRFEALLKARKQEAVERGDQEAAKRVWCYERVLEIQDRYLAAFGALKADKFFPAWGHLERVDLAWHFLEPYYKVDGDPHRVRFIAEHGTKLQRLFPYTVFASPEIVERLRCSTCNAPVHPLRPCGHRLGEIYDGEMCSHEAFDMQVLGISFVNEPGHKYSVLFPVDSESGETKDIYNYALLKYLNARLLSPFDAWDVEWTRRRHPHAHFAHVSPTDPCPCESGKTYRECCLQEEGVLRPHCKFSFSVVPPSP